jgi:hypothetical protein
MNDNLANFLRDFAAANNADFEPEQIQNLVESANLIENLIAERDDARMLYCEFVAQDHREGYVDHPEQTPQDVALSMGWDGLTFVGWDDVKTTQYWCDDCGDAIEKGNEFFYAELPCDVASANKGESATVCRKCNKRIEADCCNKDFHTSH